MSGQVQLPAALSVNQWFVNADSIVESGYGEIGDLW